MRSSQTDIRIGWTKVEIIYLRAAMSLPMYDGVCALDDIKSMTGRTIAAIRAKMKQLRSEDTARELAQTATRSIMVPTRTFPSVALAKCMDDFRWPSKEALQSGNARIVKAAKPARLNFSPD